MNLRTLMEAGPAKANELFARLSETSDSAVKTREKLFSELKSELELHISLEEQHLFPVLRRNAETKDLVADAIKDNKELRAKLAEVETLPKNDEAFPERLKDLQKTFRQHARDDKRELLPAVRRALSEEQVQGIAEKIEAGVAAADQAKQDEVEKRRLQARQEREQAERQAERQAEAERAQQAEAEQARHEEAEQRRAKLRQEREDAEYQAEQQAVAQRVQEQAARRAQQAAEAVAQTAMAASTNVLRIAEKATPNAQRVATEIQGVTSTYIDAVKRMVPNPQTAAALSKVALDATADICSAWSEWIDQTTRAGTEMSQEIVRQAASQQRQFAADVMQGWMEHNARIMRAAQEGFRPFTTRTNGSDEQRSR